jgi:SOS response associated peptidase (SRAP)
MVGLRGPGALILPAAPPCACLHKRARAATDKASTIDMSESSFRKRQRRKPINAKCETVRTLPTFRDACRRRRCIIPVDGFFEWKAIKWQKAKQPYVVAIKHCSGRTRHGGCSLSWRAPTYSQSHRGQERGRSIPFALLLQRYSSWFQKSFLVRADERRGKFRRLTVALGEQRAYAAQRHCRQRRP